MSHLDLDECSFYAIELASHFRDVFHEALKNDGSPIRSVLLRHDLVQKNQWKTFIPELHQDIIKDFHQVMLLDHPADAKTRYACFRASITNGDMNGKLWEGLWSFPQLERERQLDLQVLRKRVADLEEEWEDMHYEDIEFEDFEEEIVALHRALDAGGSLNSVSLDVLKLGLRSLVSGALLKSANEMLEQVGHEALIDPATVSASKSNRNMNIR